MNTKNIKKSLKATYEFKINSRLSELNYHDYLPEKRRIRFSFKLVSVFASIIMVSFLSVYLYFNFTSVSTLSIDINPSVELELNIFNRIIKATSDNEEGTNLIAEVNLKNKSLSSAIDVIYNYGLEHDLLIDNDLYILYGIKTEGQNRMAKIRDILESPKDNLHVLIISDFQVSLIIIENPSSGPLAPEIENADDRFDFDYQVPSNTSKESLIAIIDETDYSDAKKVLIINIMNKYNQFTSDYGLEYLMSLELHQLFFLFNE